MKELGAEYVADMRDAISGFLKTVRNLNLGLGTHHTDDSIAAKELASFRKPSAVVNAQNIASMLIESSSDHMEAFARTITEPHLPFASCTSVRSMLEPCAFAAWLVDPSIGAVDRAKRGFAMRYAAIDEESKWAKTIGQEYQVGRTYGDRLDAIERDALDLGFDPIVKKREKRIGIGCRKPSATDTIGVMLNEKSMYVLLSAVAHGQIWAMREMGFAPVDTGGKTRLIGTVPVRQFEKVVRPELIASLGLCALRSFARPAVFMLRYSGHDDGRFVALLETTFDFLRVPAERRPRWNA
ncbi:MAG: hypothetical protein ABIQ99_07425 [Thermoflexales bacterium]